MKTGLALVFAVTLFSSLSRAGGYSTGFGDEYNYAMEVCGQDGWSIDDPAPDLTFFFQINDSDSAALGGFYNIPDGPRVRLSHPVGLPLAGASFKVSLSVLASTSLYPGRDSFGWNLTDPEGNDLLTLRFVPSDSDPDRLAVTWSARGGEPVAAGFSIPYGNAYSLEVQCGSAGAMSLDFTATLKGTTDFSGTPGMTFSGSLPGLAGAQWAAVSAEFLVAGADCGDNFMVFDNLSAGTAPLVDADGDGYTAEEEAWFGTSDNDSTSGPGPALSFSGNHVSLSFPSVRGNSYEVEFSRDLLNWTPVLVAAGGPQTEWQVPEDPAAPHFFRVRKP